MTWRELIDRIKGYPSEVLDMEAYVWLYSDVEYHDGQVPIIDVSPYDSDLPVSSDNELSISLMDPEDEDNLERDFYEVVDGHIELWGWMEKRDTNWEGFYDDRVRYTYVTGDWPEVYEPNCPNMVDWAAPYQQYNDDMHENEAKAFVRDFGGTHLPLASVNEGTPDGRYWCYFDEE